NDDGKTVPFYIGDVLVTEKVATVEPTPTPETPEEEKIAMIQEITTSNLPAKDAIAKIRVGGQINN
ncbi:hypothetical protein, partial [Paenibacillus odorifer]|uniref:hypothetical protein n=1 Tax=Paenibacillus odorifer TaxID=189426 RepID=UPI0028A0E4A9